MYLWHLLILLFLFSLGLNNRVLALGNVWAQADTRSIVGSTSHMGLRSSGLFLSPLYNDVTGHTDKYLTQSMQISLVLPENSDSSFLNGTSTAFNFRWNFLTPAYQTTYGQPYLNNPPGLFAEFGIQPRLVKNRMVMPEEYCTPVSPASQNKLESSK